MDVAAGPSNTSVSRRKWGKPLKSGEKSIVLNVFTKLSEKYKTLPFKELDKLTAEFTGVSERSVQTIRSEIKKTGKLVTPGKKRKHEMSVLGTVSYTHLDVYKRQAVYTPMVF